MKKLKFVLLFLVISFLMIGCSGKKASDKAVSVAKNAVGIADDYLDGSLSCSQANDKLDELIEDMEYVNDLEQGDKNKAADFSISTSITALSVTILTDSINNTSESYDKVVEARDDLAKAAGIDKRSNKK